MTPDQTYSGWSNYPTWNAALWIDNEQGTYNERLEILNTAKTKREAAGTLKSWFEDLYPIPTTGPLADLGGWAYEHIDWREIVDTWWDEREEATP